MSWEKPLFSSGITKADYDDDDDDDDDDDILMNCLTFMSYESKLFDTFPVASVAYYSCPLQT